MNASAAQNWRPRSANGFWKAVQIVVTVGVCGWLIAKAPWGDLLGVMQGIRWPPLAAAAVVIGPVFMLLRTLRWWVLLGDERAKCRLLALLQFVWIGQFISTFLPSTVGGDVYRVAALSGRTGLRLSATSVVLDRLMGFAMIVLLGLLGLLLSPAFRSLAGLVAATIGAVGLIAVLGVLLFVSSWPQRLAEHAANDMGTKWWSRSVGRIYRGLAALADYRAKPIVMANAAALSVLIAFCPVASTWLVLAALSASVGVSEVVAPVLGSVIVAMLPIFIGGLGGREASFVGLMSVIGVPVELSGSAALIGRVLGTLWALVGGALYLYSASRAGQRSSSAAELTKRGSGGVASQSLPGV